MTDGGPLGETARSRIFGAALNAAWPDTSIGAPHTLLRSDSACWRKACRNLSRNIGWGQRST